MSSVKKSKNYCSVFGCTTYYSTDENISYHGLPSATGPKILWKNINGFEELVNCQTIWASSLRLSKEALNKKSIKVCSKHFTVNDYFRPRGKGVKMRLKPNAVPTQHLPKSSIEVMQHRKRLSSIKETPAIMQCQRVIQSSPMDFNTSFLTESYFKDSFVQGLNNLEYEDNENDQIIIDVINELIKDTNEFDYYVK